MINGMFWLCFWVTTELSICLTIDNPCFFFFLWMLWIYQLTTSNCCLTFIMFMGLAWGGRDSYISGSELQANLKFMDTSYALEWKTVLNLLWFLLFSLLFFLNLFSGGTALFYMFSNNNMLLYHLILLSIFLIFYREFS